MWLQARDKTLIYHNWTKNSRQLNRDTQAQHLSSHCMLFVCIGKKEVFRYSFQSFQLYMGFGVIEYNCISTVTEGWRESCVPYKFLYDRAGLAEEDRMSQVQY